MLISENVHACQHGSIHHINFGTCLQMMEWVSSKALFSSHVFHNYISPVAGQLGSFQEVVN